MELNYELRVTNYEFRDLRSAIIINCLSEARFVCERCSNNYKWVWAEPTINSQFSILNSQLKKRPFGRFLIHRIIFKLKSVFLFPFIKLIKGYFYHVFIFGNEVNLNNLFAVFVCFFKSFISVYGKH